MPISIIPLDVDYVPRIGPSIYRVLIIPVTFAVFDHLKLANYTLARMRAA